jgi:hypothetical protein
MKFKPDPVTIQMDDALPDYHQHPQFEASQ